MGRVRALVVAACLAVAAAPAVAGDDAPSGDFALAGCRIIPGEGDVIADGVVIVKDGKIVTVGARSEVEIPRGVRVVESVGKVLTPAFVHVGSRIGLTGNGGGNATATDPAKTVVDELDPWQSGNVYAAANGFGTLGLLPGAGMIGGRGAAVRTAAEDVESMLRKDDALLRADVTLGGRFETTLAGQLSIARKDLDGYLKWEREHAKWETDKAKAEAEKKKVPKEPKKPTLSEARAPYHGILKGEIALYCSVGSSADVNSLAEGLADERVRGDALRLYCVVSGSAFRAAPELLDLGATCVVRATMATWPGTDHTVCPAVILRSAGLPVVLMPRDDSRNGLRNYTVDLAAIVAAGYPVEEVWHAATAAAADLLGVGDVTGRIAKDHHADLLLWDGDPLLATTRLERVWIQGAPVEETR